MSDRLAPRPAAGSPALNTPIGTPPTGAQIGTSPMEMTALGTPLVARGIVGEVEPDGYDVGVPGDQPAWQRDAVSVSARVHALLATLRPFVVQVLTFWDHVVRSVRVGNRVVEVDPSGCYRVR